MTKSQFIKIKLTGNKPQFKNLIGLNKCDTQASELLDFMRFAHNGKYTCLQAQGENGKVESDKGSFVYTMFTTHILKKDIYHETQTLYKR